MRLTRQAALAIALVAGLLAALFAWMFIGQQHKPKVEAPQQVTVPVPTKTIPIGAELRPEMFGTKQFAANEIAPNTATDAMMLTGRIAVAELPANQPVSLAQVQERSAQLGMAYALNTGLRGMSVSLDVIGAVGDFVKPGDRVDVLTAFKQENQVVVRTLVQDVVVLALGQTVTAAPPAATEEGKAETKAGEQTAPRRVETPVTLALTPAQAQTVLTADQAGDLRLTLRARDDHSVVPLPVAQSWTMVGAVPKPGATGGAAAGGQQPARASATGATPQPTFAEVAAAIKGGGPTGGAHGVSGGPSVARPRKPHVEVIRGDESEYVVP